MSVDRTTEGGMFGHRDAVLSVRDTSVTFDMERGQSRVLDSATLDIKREEVLGIVGESGSGKSMFGSALLNAVVDPGVVTGDITYYPNDGDPIDILTLSEKETRRLRWEKISMVFQGAMSSFNPTLTIKGHFDETLRAHDSDIDEGRKRARQLLRDLYLNPDRVLDSYAHELSGGMKQRALIALSLVLEPEVLVVDEPTAALDLLMQRSILQLFRELKEKYDLTLVFITHDLPLIAHLADRLAVMYAFEFVETGPTDEILHHAAHPYTRALLNATPNLDAPVENMQPIEGSSPDPVNIPQGCSYHPRCPLADEQCTQQDPSLVDVEDHHRAACFYWQDAAAAIPIEIAEPIQSTPSSSVGRTARSSTESVLSLENVTVQFEHSSSVLPFFGETEVVKAVDGVSLDVAENEIIALVGESGCGKTTLGKAAIGLKRPTEGHITYHGQDIWEAKDKRGDVDIPHEEIRRSLQIIHQDPGNSLNSYRRVMNILLEPLKKWHSDLDKRKQKTSVLNLLHTVGMSPPHDYARRYPHQLSGGEKQRVALVRALLMNPDLILADEAISALDVSLRIDMMNIFLDLQEEFDTSFLFISHDLSNARYLAEKADGRIGIMYLGRIVEIGSAEQIIQDPQHPYTKALRWATPNLHVEETDEELPLQRIDIPDPVNRPSGCRFHTRCPEAREICTQQAPEEIHANGDASQVVACFRADETHEYWNSPELTDDEPIAEQQDDDSG